MLVQWAAATRPPASASAPSLPASLRVRHWSPSPQQAARRPLPPDLLPRNRRCCALIWDFPGALPASPGAFSHTRCSAPHPYRRRPGIACALAPSRRFASARPPVCPPPCAKRGVAARSRRCCGLSPRTWQLPGRPPVRALTCHFRASFLRALPGGSWSRSLWRFRG